MSSSDQTVDTDPKLAIEVARRMTKARAAEIAALIESARQVFRDGSREIPAAPDWSPPPATGGHLYRSVD